jgi:ADP-ribosyl-[dinitrogen reductase] hydrolase
LLGTAIGDALGVPFEGASLRYMSRRRPIGDWTEYQGFWGRGLVSDDTQQAVLVATVLAQYPREPHLAVAAYKRLLVRWLVALPFGAGRATLRGCFRVLTRRAVTGVRSAGNGAAMRSAVIGAAYSEDPTMRHAMTIALSEVTHTHPDAIAGALISAEVTAQASQAAAGDSTRVISQRALMSLDNAANRSDLDWAMQWSANPEDAKAPTLRSRCFTALEFADQTQTSTDEAVRAIGNTGWTNHTIPLALYWFARVGEPVPALTAAVRSGGDTDTVAAIVGAWSVTKFGVEAIPSQLRDHLQGGSYGLEHLRSLGDALVSSAKADHGLAVPTVHFGRSAARNLLSLPLLIVYAFRAALIRR